MRYFFKRFFFVVSLCSISFILMIYFFTPLFNITSLIFPHCVHPFDIIIRFSYAWKILKVSYFILYLFSNILIFNSLSFFIIHKNSLTKKKNFLHKPAVLENSLQLLVGLSDNNEKVYIPEKGLYQNILITGTIGSGKTSSVMYPFAKQLIEYSNLSNNSSLGMLILDVKGNFYKQIITFAKECDKLDDVITIGFNSNIKYNPLHKPSLNPLVLANRLRTILELFSSNNSESYWLDKVEQVIAECIKLCRLYNNGYVTFLEIHNLINYEDYYLEKINLLRKIFQSGKLSRKNIYNLFSSVNFFEREFKNLDSRVLSILKSEITRITNTFISDYNILNMFSPEESEINFKGFKEVINNGKIVVLNMNIAKYKNLSKIIAAYLKLDFQSEVLSQLSNSSNIFPTVFICDEFQEYVTCSDADFFSQSRESKCINIISTQSYTSILNSLKNESSTKTIIQNLINKLWFRTDDIFTIETSQKQIGKEDKIKISKNISENAGETSFNYFTNSLKSKKSNLSESVSSNIQNEFIYDYNFFTQKLETFNCLAFLSDGLKILKPQKIKTIPYFKNISNNISKHNNKII